MSWLTWVGGRQGTGYSKMLLAKSKLLGFDLYLIHLPFTCSVPHHTDPVPGFEHHRVNITLRNARSGGVTYIESTGPALRMGRAYHFRPDEQLHYVTPVMKGSILMLSFGWIRKRKPIPNPQILS